MPFFPFKTITCKDARFIIDGFRFLIDGHGFLIDGHGFLIDGLSTGRRAKGAHPPSIAHRAPSIRAGGGDFPTESGPVSWRMRHVHGLCTVY